MIYKSVLVLFTMFAGAFAAMADELKEKKHCHAGCGGKCKMKGMLFDPEKFKVRKGSLPVLSAPNAETDGFKQSTTSSPVSLVALPQQELVVSRVDNASILHTVSSDASKPMVSIVDANATELSGPGAVVISKDEVLPAETSAPVVESHRSDSAISGVSEVEKVEVEVKVKAFELEGQDNRGSAEQDPRTQLHREDVVTDVEGEISALKPTKPVSVELDEVAKSKTKKNHKSAEDGKADDYETGAEQDDEDDDEEENDENSDKNSKKFSLKQKRNLLKKPNISAGA